MTGSRRALNPLSLNLYDHRENRLLAGLLSSDYLTLEPHLEVVKLSKGDVLYESFAPVTHCYFLGDTLVSLLSTTEDGLSVSAGVVGGEGMMGVVGAMLDPRLLCHRTVVMVTGSASRITSEALKHWIGRNTSLRRPFLRFAHAMFVQLVQTSACNRFHDTKERLARVLLLVQDRLKARELPFTQERLACLVGTDRVSVTRAAQEMRRAKLIGYSRGQVTILNRQELESAACECYGIIGSAYDDLRCP